MDETWNQPDPVVEDAPSDVDEVPQSDPPDVAEPSNPSDEELDEAVADEPFVAQRDVNDPLAYRDRFKPEERDLQAEHDAREQARDAQRDDHNARVAPGGGLL